MFQIVFRSKLFKAEYFTKRLLIVFLLKLRIARKDSFKAPNWISFLSFEANYKIRTTGIFLSPPFSLFLLFSYPSKQRQYVFIKKGFIVSPAPKLRKTAVALQENGSGVFRVSFQAKDTTVALWSWIRSTNSTHNEASNESFTAQDQACVPILSFRQWGREKGK